MPSEKILEKTVVQLEDDSDFRDILKAFFKLPNVRLIQFSNRRDLKRWHFSNHGGDLYICDGSFPERHGEEPTVIWPKVAGLVSAVKYFKLYPTKGMILTSGELHNTKEYEPFPIVQVMQKPVEYDKLIAAVEKHLYDK
jgi:DNA-binding NtrC family response regulator